MVFTNNIAFNKAKRNLDTKAKKFGFWGIVVFVVLPILVYALFHFGIIKSGFVASDKVIAPVARISTETGSGTAFLISKKYAITARHVVNDLPLGAQVSLNFDKAKPPRLNVTGKVIYYPTDSISDFALVELLTEVGDIKPLILGSSENAIINTPILVVGYPDGEFSSTQGTISDDGEPLHYKIDAGAWPGNSGGPIIKEDTKEVVGILIAGKEGEMKGINYGFKIDPVYKNLKAKGFSVE